MNHVDKRRRQQAGFTIIELTLAMTFVTILMIMIAMTITQLANIYNKGTTLRAVDQAGRAISRDMQATLAEAQPLDINSDIHGGANFVPQIQVGGDLSAPDGGRLCTGTYSYIWNVGKSLVNPVNVYESGDVPIRLIKVRDTGALYCSDSSLKIKNDDVVELLASGDRNLALQSFRIVSAAFDPVTQQALYRIVFEVGTNDEGSLDQSSTIDTIDTTCKPPSDDASQQDFCAVNQFEFTVRTGNRGNN